VASVGAWNTVILDYRSPYIITFWSIAYAGLGHIMLDRYFRGFILMAAEILLNYISNLNTAIFYTLSGHYALAKEALDTRAVLLYLGLYSFAIFDSYRMTLSVNNTYRLADRENATVKCFAVNSSSFTIIQEASPYLALLWSAIIPGAGCFMIERMNRAFYLIVLWAANAYLAGLCTAVIYTASGQYDLARASLDIHWLLNLPSIWLYGMYEVYSCALENNKLFRRELTNFLDTEYSKTSFTMADVLKEAS
jgi:hypothetical protein